MAQETIYSIRKKVVEKLENATLDQLMEMMEIFEKDSVDWWEELPSEIQHKIEASIEQTEKGQLISHEDVLQNHAPWLAK